MTSPAVDTPVSKEKSASAKEGAKETRQDAESRSPKKRARDLKEDITEIEPEPAAFRDPKPKALKPESSRSRPAAAASLSDVNRPPAMDKPENPDSLKLISGVGPKIEATLNDLGIYTLGQIARWTEAEREWVDGYLRFNGRIDRDNWIRQAKALADGGREE